MELRGLAVGARDAHFLRFGEEVAQGVEEERKVQWLFEQRASASRQRAEQLVWRGGDDDDRNVRSFAAELLKYLPAALRGQVQIDQGEINRLLLDDRDGLHAISRADHLVSFLGQKLRD